MSPTVFIVMVIDFKVSVPVRVFSYSGEKLPIPVDPALWKLADDVRLHHTMDRLPSGVSPGLTLLREEVQRKKGKSNVCPCVIAW